MFDHLFSSYHDQIQTLVSGITPDSFWYIRIGACAIAFVILCILAALTHSRLIPLLYACFYGIRMLFVNARSSRWNYEQVKHWTENEEARLNKMASEKPTTETRRRQIKKKWIIYCLIGIILLFIIGYIAYPLPQFQETYRNWFQKDMTVIQNWVNSIAPQARMMPLSPNLCMG